MFGSLPHPGDPLIGWKADLDAGCKLVPDPTVNLVTLYVGIVATRCSRWYLADPGRLARRARPRRSLYAEPWNLTGL